jgi:flagellin-like hook-associated protein FlgL
MVEVSTLGLLTQQILQIRDAQSLLGDLSTQLATGKKSLDLSGYTLADTRRLLDFRSLIGKRSSYLDVINTVEPRLKIYDKTLTQLDSDGNEALSLINGTTSFDNAQSGALASQIQGFMQSAQYFLNQRVGDRYVFSGSRYLTAPVQDITQLTVPPGSATPVSSPTLPDYDTAAPGSSAASYATDSVNIDDGNTLTYGISSNDPAFQNLVLGLRWAYAATQDSANFSTDMDNARTLITNALGGIRNLHGTVASNMGRLDTTRDLHNTLISDLNNQIDDIQHADAAEVSTKITFVQAQLQASYSATAKIAQMSITQYL